mmetsp:Transcript_10754/g.12464  ORF Transcript_10754/g.12464 Transcript_10754/m.12464 type:complete len:95 (-) Transcript_10754:171-455(-)
MSPLYATISLESRQQAKIPNHSQQVSLCNQRLLAIQAEVQRKNDSALDSIKHTLQENMECESELCRLIQKSHDMMHLNDLTLDHLGKTTLPKLK